MIYKAL